MCLAIPGQVISFDDSIDVGEVEIGGVVRKVSFDLVTDVKVGDYVLVHAGFAIERINEAEAKKTLALFEELAQHEIS